MLQLKHLSQFLIVWPFVACSGIEHINKDIESESKVWKKNAKTTLACANVSYFLHFTTKRLDSRLIWNGETNCVIHFKHVQHERKTSLKPETFLWKVVSPLSKYHARNSFVGCIVFLWRHIQTKNIIDTEQQHDNLD